MNHAVPDSIQQIQDTLLADKQPFLKRLRSFLPYAESLYANAEGRHSAALDKRFQGSVPLPVSAGMNLQAALRILEPALGGKTVRFAVGDQESDSQECVARNNGDSWEVCLPVSLLSCASPAQLICHCAFSLNKASNPEAGVVSLILERRPPLPLPIRLSAWRFLRFVDYAGSVLANSLLRDPDTVCWERFSLGQAGLKGGWYLHRRARTELTPEGQLGGTRTVDLRQVAAFHLKRQSLTMGEMLADPRSHWSYPVLTPLVLDCQEFSEPASVSAQPAVSSTFETVSADEVNQLHDHLHPAWPAGAAVHERFVSTFSLVAAHFILETSGTLTAERWRHLQTYLEIGNREVAEIIDDLEWRFAPYGNTDQVLAQLSNASRGHLANIHSLRIIHDCYALASRDAGGSSPIGSADSGTITESQREAFHRLGWWCQLSQVEVDMLLDLFAKHPNMEFSEREGF